MASVKSVNSANPIFLASATHSSDGLVQDAPLSIGKEVMQEAVQILHQKDQQRLRERVDAWMAVNSKLHDGAEGRMTRITDAEFSDQFVSDLMGEYYKAQKDPNRASWLPAPHYEKLLNKVKHLFFPKQHVRIGLVCLDQVEESTRIPAPSYWPREGIKASSIVDLLAQLDGKTDLMSVGIGLGNQSNFSFDENGELYKPDYERDKEWDPFEGLEDHLEEIFFKLSEIKRSNPQCDVSLSTGWAMEIEEIFRALEKYPDSITTLNFIIAEDGTVPEVLARVKDNAAIRTIRFHLCDFQIDKEISQSFCDAMKNRQTPLSLECRSQPNMNQLPDGIGGGAEMRDMMVGFAKSGNVQSLLLEVQHYEIRGLLTMLNKANEFDRLRRDERDAEKCLKGMKEILESGLEQMKQEENLQFGFEVRHVDIRSNTSRQARARYFNSAPDPDPDPQDAFYDYEIRLMKNP